MKARKPKTKAGRGVAAGAEGFLKGVQQGMQMGMYRAMQQQEAQKDESLKYADWLSSEAKSIKNPKMRADAVNLAHQLRTGDTFVEDAKNYVKVNKLFSEEAFTPQPKPVTPVPPPSEITEAEWQTKVAKQMEPQRKFAEKEYARLVAMKRGDSSFQFQNEQGEWETLPVKIAEWTPELKKALDFYTNQLREFGIVTSETPVPIPEDTDDLDDIIEDLLQQRRPAEIQSSSKPTSIYQQSGMMTPGAMRKSGRKPVG